MKDIHELNLNELYLIYRQDKRNYEVVNLMQQQLDIFGRHILKNKVEDDDDKNQILIDAIYEFWIRISDKNEHTIDIEDNYSITQYYKRIVLASRAKFFKELHKDQSTFHYDKGESEEIIAEYYTFQDQRKVLSSKIFFDECIDFLIDEGISDIHIQWFVSNLQGVSFTDLSHQYHVSDSYINRVVKRLIKKIRNKMKGV